MSRSGYTTGNLPSSQTHDAVAVKSTRRDSPVLPHGTSESDSGRPGLYSPSHPTHFQTRVNTRGDTQGLSPSQMIHPSVQGGFQNGPLNGIPSQQPLSAGQQSMLMRTNQSRSANSTPLPPLPGALSETSRRGSAPLPNSGLQSSTTTLTGPSLGQSLHPSGSQYLSSLSGPSMLPTNSHGVSSPSTLTAGTAMSSQAQPTAISPSSYYGIGMSLTGPTLAQVPTQPVRPSPWQTSLNGSQPGAVSPISQSPTTGLTSPPTGQMVGSAGQQLLPPMSMPPGPVQGGPPPTSSAGQVSTGSLSKRRVYPSQSQGGSYPNQGYPGAATLQQPPSTMTSSSTTQRGQPAMSGFGQGSMPNMPNQSTNQFINNQMTTNQTNQLSSQMNKLTVQQSDSLPIDLLARRNIQPPDTEPANSSLPPDLQKKNAKPSILSCTLNSVPENHSLLQKCKLPFGILVHPFKDLSVLPVIHSTSIVRCRSCRTYINPFVTFTEMRRWRCNMCYRINEVPEDFCFDPQTKSYGEPIRRPEIKSATYEFIAPSEYMLRAPQPASYVFAFDVSFNAIETGYLKMACQLIKENLDKIPGDSRALIGFLTFNKSVNFYNLRNDQSQPHMLIVSDVEDIFLPAPEDLLVNIRENKEMIIQFLDSLPETFASTHDIHSAAGAAVQAALKLLSATGGRITVFQTTLPSIGPGALQNRDEPGVKSKPQDAVKLNPATDFYKKLALDCAADQVSVDVFLLSSQYSDIASLMCASKYSGGCVSYFPNFHISKNHAMVKKFENELVRYLTRKIGFEAVMRVRCTKGLSIHTFHGNFFVRSTDLLSLPNVNPDAVFAMQISIEESLTDTDLACFQSALLYTSSRGERRIRVHNLALPITKKMSDVYTGANVNAITLMLSKMAVDRTLSASLGDAREALMNAIVDCLGVYKSALSGHTGQLLAPSSLKLLPLFILALLKQNAFRLGCSASLDSRCFALQQFKVMPFNVTLLTIYPALYSLHDMSDEGALQTKSGSVPQPPRLLLSGEKLSRVGIFLMDAGQEFYIWVGKEASNVDIQCLFGVPNYSSIPEDMEALPELNNTLSNRVRSFIDYLQSERTNHSNLYVLRGDSRMRMMFIDKLMNDRTESMMSYHEFLVHLQGQVN